jgi:hypothetical protein
MGVQNDAGELLLFFYDELIKNGKNSVTTKDVSKATKWVDNRIKAAFSYLNDLNVFYSYLGSGLGSGLDITENFDVTRLLPKGIKIVENQQKFKNEFGLEVNLASLKFSWSTKVP